MDFYVFYLHIGIAVAILLAFFPAFISKIGHDIERRLPRSEYIGNEEFKLETGRHSDYFIERKYPNLYIGKNLTFKYSLTKENLAACFIIILVIGILQIIAHEILKQFISTHNHHSEKYFIATCLIIDFTAYWCTVMSVVNAHISSIIKELEHLKYSYSFPK